MTDRLWVAWTDEAGHTLPVGEVSLLGAAQIQSFTYTPAWLEDGFEIGADLPLRPGPQSPADGSSTFSVLDDASPDSWGRKVISRSRPLAEVGTSLGMLAAVADESRQGALRLSTGPGDPPVTTGAVAPVGELHSLLADVEAFVRGEADDRTVRRIYLGSSSQGGARPKTALRREDGSLVVAKFPSELDSYDVLTCEAVALGVARDAGLVAASAELLRIDDARAVLLVERFDRTATGRRGYQSMRTAAMLGDVDGFSYRVAADTARYVAGRDAVRGVVGAAALAVCVHNIDDHSRNLGFLRRGRAWGLAPLFDVVPYPDEQTGTPLEETSTGRSLEQLLDIDWGLSRSEVLGVVSRVAQVARGAWARAPRAFGLDPELAGACGAFVESACDFDTVLDGTEPRFSS